MSRLTVVFWALCAVLALGIAAGCSDDSGTTSGGDTGGPDANDVGGDMAPDMIPDAVADQGTDTGGEDAEPDTPVLPEVCEPGDCTDPQACVGGACVDPVDDLDQYATDAADRNSSYFWSIQLPALYPEPETCCFDYDPSPGADDGLGDLLDLLSNPALGLGDFDIQGTIDASLVDGTITLVTDWTEFPESGDGDVTFSIFVGSNDLDGDGEPDQPFWNEMTGECEADTRCGGDGAYELDPVSFGDHGSQVQFNVGLLESGVVYAGPSTFTLTLDIELLGGEPITLTLLDAQIEAPISVEANGIHTIDEIRLEGTDDEFFAAGGKLGGAIDAGEIVGLLDDQFRGCACANVNPEDPVITSEVNTADGILEVVCTDNQGDAENSCTGEGEGDGPLCPQIGIVCSFAPLIANVLDVDRDNDGVFESLSAGLRFAWSGAEVSGLDVATE